MKMLYVSRIQQKCPEKHGDTAKEALEAFKHILKQKEYEFIFPQITQMK